MPADERQTFAIRPRPPFRLDFCAWALRRRATNLVDRWDGTTYRRVVAIDGRPAEVAMRQLGSTNTTVLQVTVRGSRLAPEIRSSVKALLERVFGLQVDLRPFRRVAARERLLELDGVGRRTAEYALLRGLGRLDVFPGDDVGARKRLARWLNRRTSFDYEGVQAAVRRWHPYSGFAYFHLLLQGLLEAGELGTSWCADGVKAMR